MPATRRAEELQRSPKEYVAGVTFGATTPSYDREKEIDRFCPLDGVSEAALRTVLPDFLGEQDQVAPLFSAKSVDGVRAYETARRLLREAQRTGRAFDPGEVLQSSRINIYDLELLSWHGEIVQDFVDDGQGRIRVAPVDGLQLPTAMIRVACSKGTYIRALARDLGEALGSGAFLSSLRRTKNGGFDISQSWTLDEVLGALNQNDLA